MKHENKEKVLMCCSELSVKGGMVSVVKNYLNYPDWDNYENRIYTNAYRKNKIICCCIFCNCIYKDFMYCINKKYQNCTLTYSRKRKFF